MVALLLLLAPAPGTAAPAASGATVGAPPLRQAAVLRGSDCTEVAAIVSVPPARVARVLPRGYVPASFLTTALGTYTGAPLDGVPGEGSVLMGVGTCERGNLDGRPLGRFSFGERVVQVRPQDDHPGFHFYAVEQVTDNRRIATALRHAGFPVQLVRSADSRAGAVRGFAEGGTVRIETTTPIAVPSPLDDVSIWREVGRRTSVLRLDVRDARSTGGLGTVDADPGSPMARLIGSPRSAGIGAVNRYDLVARAFSTVR